MLIRKASLFFLMALLVAGPVGPEESGKPSDPLAPVRVLEGIWEGEGEGFGQRSEVSHEWERVLGGKFLRLRTRSVTRSEDGKESVHEDVGYMSWSEGERLLRFRQFLSEGFVNTFRVDVINDPISGFNFEPESTEGSENLVARMTLRFTQPIGYEMILELGKRGEPLKACQTMKLKKVR